MSCGSKAVVAVNSVTLEMTVEQRKTLVDIYARGAAVRVAIRQFSTSKIATPDSPLPNEYRLTMVGCNNNNQVKISTMINAIYAVVRDVAASQSITLDGRFTHTCISRLDASYTGNEFGFLFTADKDSLSVIIVPKIYPKAGTEITKYCVEKNQWGKYHDGLGGEYTQLIKENAVACGYIPPEPAGQFIRHECKGFDQWAVYHDGNYGTTTNLIKQDSTECGYIPPRPAGELITTMCRGKDQWGVYTDGTGGTRNELIQEKSTDCGYVAPPPAGQLIRTECRGTTQTRIEADGTGGERSVEIESNSPACGYVPPVVPEPSGGPPPSPTPPPGGNPPTSPQPPGGEPTENAQKNISVIADMSGSGGSGQVYLSATWVWSGSMGYVTVFNAVEFYRPFSWSGTSTISAPIARSLSTGYESPPMTATPEGNLRIFNISKATFLAGDFEVYARGDYVPAGA